MPSSRCWSLSAVCSFDHFDAERARAASPRSPSSPWSASVCTTGVLAGLLGVGGGIVMVPAMIVLFGIPPVVAKGTSAGGDHAHGAHGHVAQPRERPT